MDQNGRLDGYDGMDGYDGENGYNGLDSYNGVKQEKNTMHFQYEKNRALRALIFSALRAAGGPSAPVGGLWPPEITPDDSPNARISDFRRFPPISVDFRRFPSPPKSTKTARSKSFKRGHTHTDTLPPIYI